MYGKTSKNFFIYEPPIDLFESYFFFNSVRSWLIGRYIYIGKQVTSFIHHITRFSAVGTPAIPPCQSYQCRSIRSVQIYSPDTVMFPIRIISCYEYSVWQILHIQDITEFQTDVKKQKQNEQEPPPCRITVKKIKLFCLLIYVVQEMLKC